MSISALANAFNNVYKKALKVLSCICSNFKIDYKAGLYETKQTLGAIICEFFAGVALPHYALKRDVLDDRRGLQTAPHNLAAPPAKRPRNITTIGSVQ